MEFKFNEVTVNSLSCYLKALEVLKEDKEWRFCSVVLDKKDPKFSSPQDKLAQWECYLRWIKHLLKNNIRSHEKAVLLADFLRRPTGEVHKFSTLPAIVPNLEDVLQVESQGVLLVQFADVLLGSSLYEGNDKVKVELSQPVHDLLNGLGKSPGGKRYNCWNPIWRE